MLGDIKDKRCSDTKEQFNKVLDNTKSDAFFALGLSRPSKEGGFAFLFDTDELYLEKRGQFEELLKFVLRSQGLLWQSDNISWLRLHLSRKSSLPSIDARIVSSDRSVSLLNDVGLLWVSLLKDFGPLPLNEKHLNKHHYLQAQTRIAMVHVEPPTAHEQLEAKLKLLEWAKTHLPPQKYAEIEALEF